MKRGRLMSRSKVFIVDDDDAFREETAEMLRQAGYAVGTVGNGSEALSRIEEERPDIIFLDFVMADNGNELARKLKSSAGTSDIPVILMSGRSREKIAAALDDLSDQDIIEDFLEKPVNPLDLISAIEINIDGR